MAEVGLVVSGWGPSVSCFPSCLTLKALVKGPQPCRRQSTRLSRFHRNPLRRNTPFSLFLQSKHQHLPSVMVKGPFWMMYNYAPFVGYTGVWRRGRIKRQSRVWRLQFAHNSRGLRVRLCSRDRLVPLSQVFPRSSLLWVYFRICMSVYFSLSTENRMLILFFKISSLMPSPTYNYGTAVIRRPQLQFTTMNCCFLFRT